MWNGQSERMRQMSHSASFPVDMWEWKKSDELRGTEMVEWKEIIHTKDEKKI